MSDLVPSYLDLNFDTIKQDLKDKLEISDVFKDYNTDASNITILMELMAYLGELTSYYLNKIAKNIYADTADMRENLTRIGYLVGYYPPGALSSRTTITVTVPASGGHNEGACQVGDTVRANAWTRVYTDSSIVKYEKNAIDFTVTQDVFHTVTEFPFTMEVPVSQGTPRTYTFYGRDMIDETLYLPKLKFGYDDDLDDDIPAIIVTVNGEQWERVNEFYDELSGLDPTDNVYVFRVNKYGQHIVRFSNIRNIPAATDEIIIKAIETLGVYGNVMSNSITKADSAFLTTTPVTAGYDIEMSSSKYSIVNTSASTGGKEQEDIEQIRIGITRMANAQYRCVTKSDYISFLEEHGLIKKAQAWGERETTLGGNILDYNKVYISLNPYVWNGNIVYTENQDGIKIASAYTTSFMDTISVYLEPRKLLTVYEVFVLPVFAYFKFNMGIKIKRNYRFSTVREDVKSKLSYYFDSMERTFGELLSFMDVINYIIDPTKVSATNTFSNVKGIYHLVIRDIATYDPISNQWIDPYEYNSNSYPQYSQYEAAVTSTWDENVLKNIQLDHHQYPMVSIRNCNFLEEA